MKDLGQFVSLFSADSQGQVWVVVGGHVGQNDSYNLRVHSKICIFNRPKKYVLSIDAIAHIILTSCKFRSNLK